METEAADIADDSQVSSGTSVEELEGQSQTRQFVTFVVGDEVFAVDMSPVKEIIRVPEVVRVPLAPPNLEGLANLRGKVLPIMSLRRVFGFGDRPVDDATRALVIDLGQPLGFIVDKVLSVIAVEPGRVEGVTAIKDTIDTDLLGGMIKDTAGHAMIMVLDFERVVGQRVAKSESVKKAGLAAIGAEPASSSDSDDEVEGDEIQLVSFGVAQQEYAITIEDVQEIVQMPEHVVHVPHSAAHVLGVMTLRSRLLPLVSLRRMFSLPARDADERSRIVVVGLGGASVGIVMDTVNEVLRVSRSDLQAVPSLLAREGSLAEVSEMCRLDGGKRIVSIISTAALFRQSAIKDALGAVNAAKDELVDGEEMSDSTDDDEQVVAFRLGDEEFGVPIASVQEIVRVPEQLTRVPKAPSFVEGVINLRGTVLPVVDLRRRLGLPMVEKSDRQRVMVFMLEGVRTGFIVDQVAEVLKIPKSAIEPTPQLSLEQSRLFARMANLEKQKRMVQLLVPSELLESEDRAALSAIAA